MNQIASLLGITNTNPPEGADRWIPIEQWPMHQPLESPFGKPLLYGPNKTLPGQFNYEKLEAMPTAGNTGISVKVVRNESGTHARGSQQSSGGWAAGVQSGQGGSTESQRNVSTLRVELHHTFGSVACSGIKEPDPGNMSRADFLQTYMNAYVAELQYGLFCEATIECVVTTTQIDHNSSLQANVASTAPSGSVSGSFTRKLTCNCVYGRLPIEFQSEIGATSDDSPEALIQRELHRIMKQRKQTFEGSTVQQKLKMDLDVLQVGIRFWSAMPEGFRISELLTETQIELLGDTIKKLNAAKREERRQDIAVYGTEVQQAVDYMEERTDVKPGTRHKISLPGLPQGSTILINDTGEPIRVKLSPAWWMLGKGEFEMPSSSVAEDKVEYWPYNVFIWKDHIKGWQKVATEWLYIGTWSIQQNGDGYKLGRV